MYKFNNVILLLLMSGIAFRCVPQENKSQDLNNCGEVAIQNKELVSVLNNFVDVNLSGYNDDYAIELRYSPHNDTLGFVLTYSLFNFEYDETPPTMYFHHRGKVVLVYTGLESEVAQNPRYIECFNKAISYLETITKIPTEDSNISEINLGPTSNPSVWQVMLIKGKVVSKKILN